MEATAEPKGPVGALHHRTLRIQLLARLRIAMRGFRNSDVGVVAAAALIGGAIGLGVAVVHESVLFIHHLLFGVPIEAQLSGTMIIEAWRVALVPTLGGLFYGGVAQLARRWRPGDIVDAIEANALYGGRMSLGDSLRLTFLTILSAGTGASIGLEAAYTQFGAGAASWLGRSLRLRRADLRTFVGCGAAAAIAAAFNAPLAGAFYAFELVIGGYTMGNLAPVAIAALAGAIVNRQLFGGAPIYIVYDPLELNAIDYALATLLGIGGAGVGILAMTGVTMVEGWFRKVELPLWLRPTVGGVFLGLIALVYPQTLGSGHGGIVTVIASGFALPLVIGLIVAKLFASAIAIGSGFRGGMFSAALFLGSLYGDAAGALLALAFPDLAAHETLYTLAGMGAVAAAVVGAPVTMILLVLEVTSDFSATIGVTAAVLLAAFATRRWFGYSFATWRFHLRGVQVHGAHDIGWLHELTVGRVMRRDFATIETGASLAELRRRFPLGGPKIVFALDGSGHYAGMVDIQEAHSADLDAEAETRHVADLTTGVAHFLAAGQSVRLALDLFIAAETETLPVLAAAGDRRIIGYLSEAYALRRYNRELEARHREEIGEDELFSPTHAPPAG
jgi:CIC family chloride channel protein